jgi:alpha-N-arabinofuranosidase
VAQDYHWQWGIGARDLRPIWTNVAWSHAPEPNDLGTDEYLALCERVHAQPSITVNVNGAGATPQEAAAWVEYVNGAATTKYGGLRAKNGHPSPYGVRQWELGNEVFGDWVRGHVDAGTYAQSVLQYADAMRAVDPNLKLIAVGAGVDWNTTLLKLAGSRIDYLAIHDYTELSENANAVNPRAQMMQRASEFEASHRQTAELIAQLVPTRTIKLIVNEWNLFYPVDVIESMDGAVYASRMMNGFEREGGIVEANCISDLLNGWIGGVIQVSRGRLYGTSQYYAIKLYNDHLGTERLFADVSSPELAPGIKSVDAVVTRSPDRRKVFVKMSNADKQHAVTVAVDLGKFAYRQQVSAIVLRGSDSARRNTFAHPDTIIPVEQTLRCSGRCSYSLPADAVVVLTFRK